MKPTIVIVDDEPHIRRMLRIALKSEGYQVIEAADGESGLKALANGDADLVVLDLGLPDLDGHQVLARLRCWSAVPVIILSVRDNDKEKVAALDQGAQDYVTKPFSVVELLARVRANLRDQLKPSVPAELRDERLCINFVKREVTLNGHIVELTPKEYAVLSRLAASANCVVTQTQLLQEIWGPVHRNNSHYLRIVVSHLRQKLKDDPSQPHYLRTEAGVGYRFMFNSQ